MFPVWQMYHSVRAVCNMWRPCLIEGPGLQGNHQVLNAALAVHLTNAFLRATQSPLAHTAQDDGDTTPLLSDFVLDGLQSARWPGRCQEVSDPAHAGLTWFLDGAHTRESLDCCVEWFVAPDVVLRERDTL